MNKILEKFLNRLLIDEHNIEKYLYDICENVHASCNGSCPVFEKNGEIPWKGDNCQCFKNGRAMLAFLRKK